MGLRTALRINGAARPAAPVLEAAASAGSGIATSGIRTPFGTSSTLSQVVWSDIFGSTTSGPVLRADALSVPAVTKGVTLVTSALSSCPLKVYEGAAEVEAPRWMYATDGAVAPQYRMAFIVEDLVLGGWSVLIVDRDTDGNILSADRVRPDLWQFDDIGNVVIGNEIADPKTIILIKGPHDGILTTGARTLRAAINLENAWIRTVKNPLPAVLLKQVGDDVLEDDEIDGLLSAWRLARQDPDGAVAYIPSNIAVEALGEIVANVLVEARNASAIDIARLIGVPASAVDAGAVTSSLTYNNTNVGVGLVLAQQGYKPYADAIAAALSMDNVVPAGQRTALDMTELLADAANISRSGSPTKD